MYRFIALVSLLLRQFYLPNPFEVLQNYPEVVLYGITFYIPPIVLNILAEPILYPITYCVVSVYYQRGSAPEYGSFLYFMFYCIHIFLLWLMCLMNLATWTIVMIIILYVFCHIGWNILKNSRYGI